MKIWFKLFLIFILSLSFSLEAQTLKSSPSASSTESLVFEGKFLAQEGDSAELITSILVREATLDAILKELKANELVVEPFLKKLEDDFNNEFLKNSHKTPQKDLRLKRLELLSRFGNLSLALPTYFVKEQGVSPTNAKEHFIRLTGKQDKEAIRALYYGRLREGNEYRFSSLTIVPQFELVNSSISDLLVENENQLFQSVGTSWKKGLSSSLEKNVGEFILGQKDAPMATAADSLNSLYLRIKIRIEKIKDRASLGEREFLLKGEYGLLEMKSGLLMASGTFDEKKVTVLIHDKNSASNFASALYRVPLVEFATLSKKLDSFSKLPESMSLEVKGVSSIQSLLNLCKFLNSQGMEIQLKATIKSYSGPTGSLTLVYQGRKEDLSKVLKSLHHKKIESGETLNYNDLVMPILELQSMGGIIP